MESLAVAVPPGTHAQHKLPKKKKKTPEKATVSSIFTVSSAHRPRGAGACMELPEDGGEINKAFYFRLKSPGKRQTGNVRGGEGE